MRLIRRPQFPATIAGLLVVCALASNLIAGENYALLVAVGDYDLKELRPLKFTRSDVIAFHAALVDSGFPSKNIVLMHDDVERLSAHYRTLGGGHKPKDFLPLAANVRKELELLLGRLRADDSVVVAFSGHGVQFRGEKKSYFCPADAKLEQKDSLIGFDEVFAALKECEAGRRLFLVDACQNDPLSEIGKSRQTVNLDSVTRPQTESVPEGIIALFSCKAGQRSFELPELGHGVFFYHLLDGWKGNADLNGDGKLSYQEIALHTEEKTAEFAAVKLKVLQTPQLKTDFSGQWILRELEKNLPPPLFDAKNGKTAAEAKASQEAWAKHLKTPVEIRNSIGMTLRLIPPGEYLRGSTPDEAGAVLRSDPTFEKEWLDREQPQHVVRLTKPFFVASTEVTRGQFRRFVEAAGHKTDAEKDGKGGWGYSATDARFEQKTAYSWRNAGFTQTDEHPVVNVSWNDAVAFMEWLSREERKTYRLPTEAEWEYACRAGTRGVFSGGDSQDSLNGIANVADESHKRIKGISPARPFAGFDDGFPFTAPAAKFRPNAFGLFDMHGNVFEWCSDWEDAREYARLAERTVENPGGPPSGTHRVRRGGGWFGRPASCRSANRSRDLPSYSHYSLGFRVLLAP